MRLDGFRLLQTNSQVFVTNKQVLKKMSQTLTFILETTTDQFVILFGIPLLYYDANRRTKPILKLFSGCLWNDFQTFELSTFNPQQLLRVRR